MRDVLVAVMDLAVALSEDDGAAIARAHDGPAPAARLARLPVDLPRARGGGGPRRRGGCRPARRSAGRRRGPRPRGLPAGGDDQRPADHRRCRALPWPAGRGRGPPADAAVILGRGDRLRGAEDPTNPVVIGLTSAPARGPGRGLRRLLRGGRRAGRRGGRGTGRSRRRAHPRGDVWTAPCRVPTRACERRAAGALPYARRR